MIGQPNVRMLKKLFNTPTHMAFRAILSILDTLPASYELPLLMKEAEEALSDWPDQVRHLYVNELTLPPIIESNSWGLVRAIHCEHAVKEIVPIVDTAPYGALTSVALHVFDDADLATLANSRFVHELQTLDLTLYRVSGECLRDGLSRLPRLRSLTINAIAHDNPLDVWVNIVEVLQNSHFKTLHLSGMPEGFASELVLHVPKTLSDFGCFRLSHDDLRVLCRSESFCSNIHALRLDRNYIGDSGAAVIALCPYFRRLDVLRLPFNGVTEQGLRTLRNAAFVPTLRELDLSDNPLGDSGFSVVTELPFKCIEHLLVAGAEITSIGCQAIVGADQFRNLSVLRLDVNQIADEGAAALAKARALRGLKSLGIGVNGVTKHGLVAICREQHLSTVRNLWIDGNEFHGADVEPLAQSHCFRSLRQLDVANCSLGDEGASAIANGNWMCLQSLNLWNTGIGDSGLSALAKSPSLTQLLDLNVFRGRFGDTGVLSLASSTSLQFLVRLVLGSAGCSGDSIATLASSDVVRHLDEVGVLSHFETWLSSVALRPVAKGSVRRAMNNAAAHE